MKVKASAQSLKSTGTMATTDVALGDQNKAAAATAFLRQNAAKLASASFNEIDMMCQLSKYDRQTLGSYRLSHYSSLNICLVLVLFFRFKFTQDGNILNDIQEEAVWQRQQRDQRIQQFTAHDRYGPLTRGCCSTVSYGYSL
jgi:hypothetical protein